LQDPIVIWFICENQLIIVISGKVFEVFVSMPATDSQDCETARGLNARRGGLIAESQALC